MTFLTRNSIRAIARRAPRTKSFATNAGTYEQEQAALKHHAEETTDLWRKISFYFCAPAVLTCVAWVYKVEGEHAAHTEHLKEEHGGHLPEVAGYDYLNRRTKPYPWGANTLFFNPHVNKNLEEE
ncbi:mitochondrial cytochrome c oxidase subunit VIa [Pluteus cervinus]|uniref:Mitochondrial cytochrome c oxidase subunit VIa n=1 Tax=Pluteus cervinus TaxID=181527 RepID=A0ACD3BJ49_9AGAR|nr:mitochondrial cytochrome c oxidase subunit VIa [Pluteus cervinus]